jgi:phosphatidylinositol-3-phosphatase
MTKTFGGFLRRATGPALRLLSTAALALLVLHHEGVAAAAPAVPTFDHVFIVLMENQPYTSIIGNTTNAPYINSLASQYGVAANYSAAAHPSLPNYLALTGGDTFGITSDCTTCFVGAPNIVADRVEPSGRTWKAYMESMPSACFAGDSSPYAQKHDPFFYFNDIRTNATECNRIVPYSTLSSDLLSASTTPNYVFITPNLCDDMHDSCAPLNNQIRQGDQWLEGQLPSILASPAFSTQRSLVLVVWDEDDSSGNNRVAALVIAKGVPPGFRSPTAYSHYSILKTIEQSWGLGSLTTNDGNANAMSDFFPAPAVPAGGLFAHGALLALLGVSGTAVAMRNARRRRKPGEDRAAAVSARR